jgi:hypothetical protein
MISLIGKEVEESGNLPNLRCCPSICLKELRKITENLSG